MNNVFIAKRLSDKIYHTFTIEFRLHALYTQESAPSDGCFQTSTQKKTKKKLWGVTC